MCTRRQSTVTADSSQPPSWSRRLRSISGSGCASAKLQTKNKNQASADGRRRTDEDVGWRSDPNRGQTRRCTVKSKATKNSQWWMPSIFYTACRNLKPHFTNRTPESSAKDFPSPGDATTILKLPTRNSIEEATSCWLWTWQRRSSDMLFWIRQRHEWVPQQFVSRGPVVRVYPEALVYELASHQRQWARDRRELTTTDLVESWYLIDRSGRVNRRFCKNAQGRTEPCECMSTQKQFVDQCSEWGKKR